MINRFLFFSFSRQANFKIAKSLYKPMRVVVDNKLNKNNI